MSVVRDHKGGNPPPTTELEAAVPTTEPTLDQSAKPEGPSFDEVFHRYCRFVWRVLARLGVSTPDLPDICQDVFVVIHRRLGSYEEQRASLPSWIYGICARTASDYRRHTRTRKELASEFLPEMAIASSQHESLEAVRARARLADVLSGMEETKQMVFMLYELDELPMTKVALMVGCPLQTAYSRLHAARREIVAAFSEDEKKASRT